ncbi:hypothetical protein CEXT_49811 [Caerostris extrusa]|uniref:Uncharacterized protein n=1 Tax=Caerostris extrusa TaxID=172846 RepID=A0AAV4NEG3_CAEEX|nr:hypothetical protein CEXT_49811 [Caerostris extrusa]
MAGKKTTPPFDTDPALNEANSPEPNLHGDKADYRSPRMKNDPRSFFRHLAHPHPRDTYFHHIPPPHPPPGVLKLIVVTSEQLMELPPLFDSLLSPTPGPSSPTVDLEKFSPGRRNFFFHLYPPLFPPPEEGGRDEAANLQDFICSKQPALLRRGLFAAK